MQHAALFVQSVLIGLSIAAPVGPIGLLVIQRTLQRGGFIGLATGLGAAAADALYGAVGAFGVYWLIDALTGARVPLALFGGAFLLWLAWHTWRSTPTRRAALAGGGAWRCFAGTFVLTLSNPTTIFSFIAVFGALGARAAPAAPGLMVAGVALGSAAWWLLLCTLVARLRARFDAAAQTRVNRLSALALAGFALWQWAGLLRG